MQIHFYQVKDFVGKGRCRRAPTDFDRFATFVVGYQHMWQALINKWAADANVDIQSDMKMARNERDPTRVYQPGWFQEVKHGDACHV